MFNVSQNPKITEKRNLDPLNWIQAARALMIIMNCFNLIGGILIVTAGCINKRNIFAMVGGLFAFAGK